MRVDVSADGGETWTTAELGKGAEQPMHKAWAWTLWSASVPLPEGAKEGEVKIVCKAVDAAHNQQPERTGPIWNLRGILNNSWHGVTVNVEKDS